MTTSNTTQPNANGPSGPGGILVLDKPKVVDALPDGLIPAKFYFDDLKISLETPWAVLPATGRFQYVIFEWAVHGARPADTPRSNWLAR
ncbi:hypothetical protein [Pseudomonas palleroniana]|uniref:hypothetical protein n=1 Tax=Pseudomonas palleroniana TaxID=191390 RepID=UPI001FD5BDE7|nr:hypothetical protein [Pseudomonas palleroniana]UOP09978.1 hypothetical protein LDL65_23270 [Pseudomonas palleroniana]